MPRSNRYGEVIPEADSPRPNVGDGKKDPMRGVGPERLARLSRSHDSHLSAMCALAVDDKPIRGRKAVRLAELTRACILHLESFNQEVEAAL